MGGVRSSILNAVVVAVAGVVLAFAWLGREEVRCGIVQVREDWESNPDLEECAAANVPRAQAYLGMLHWAAIGSVQGGSEAWGLEPGLTEQELQTKGRRLLEAASQRGDHVAQNELGFANLNGLYGMPKDLKQALHRLQSADDSGDPIAPYTLARMHYAGRGVPESTSRAEVLLRHSASRGFKPALCTLAFLRERDGNEARATALLLAAAALDGGDLCVASYDVMPEFRTPEGGVSRSPSIVERTTLE